MQNVIAYYKHLKPEMMPEMKLKQLLYESETWKRLFGFMLEENVHLKNRLSEILKNGFDKNLLEDIEDFQNRIIKEDVRIGLLRNEVVELEKLQTREIFEDGQILKVINTKIRKLRNNIMNAEEQFSKLKIEFNSYLLENI